MRYLIVGLGNPGILYENTRHNIGFKAVKKFAKKHEFDFKREKKFKAKMAHGFINDKEIYLMLPQTYMNLSGDAVKLAKDYYKIDIKNILIVVDDADISFNQLRLKEDSGSGGHRGLDSIEKQLSSNAYPRLRIGIGREDENDLKKYVLNRFSKDEKNQLDDLLEHVVDIISLWLKDGMKKAANVANIRKKANKQKETK